VLLDRARTQLPKDASLPLPRDALRSATLRRRSCRRGSRRGSCVCGGGWLGSRSVRAQPPPRGPQCRPHSPPVGGGPPSPPIRHRRILLRLLASCSSGVPPMILVPPSVAGSAAPFLPLAASRPPGSSRLPASGGQCSGIRARVMAAPPRMPGTGLAASPAVSFAPPLAANWRISFQTPVVKRPISALAAIASFCHDRREVI
jgi:hypothetical protein